jgi:peptidoglycan/LPS O-acetylase OafA/YrhL
MGERAAVTTVSPSAATEIIPKVTESRAPSGPAAPPAPTPEPPRLHFPAVDGLRGLAILSVLLYHTSWFDNGLFGVDVFMVLSGFLITLLLFREADRSGRIAIGAFYRRRFKRLMPGLSITLLAVLVLALAFGGLGQAKDVGRKAIAALLQVANWQQIANNDAYWEGFGHINPLAHMWSLSITEQFYLAWPVVFVLLYLAGRRSATAVTVLLLVGLAGTAAIAPLMFDGTNADRLYLGTDTRTVDFLAGAVAAGLVFVLHRRAAGRKHANGNAGMVVATVAGVISLLGLIVISVLTASYREPWLYQGGIAAVAVVTSVLIIALSRADGPLVKVFSFGPLAEIGRISYTMYLLHLPIYWVMQEQLPTISPYALFLVGGGVTWLASMVMHYAITERIRLRPWRAVRATPVAIVTAVANGGGGLYLPDPVAYRMNPGDRPVLLVLGDSLAGDFAQALALDATDEYAAIDGSIDGCGVMPATAMRPRSGVVWPMAEKCKIRERLWGESLHAADYTAVVVHLGWDAADQQIDGRWITPCDADYRTRYAKELTRMAEFVKRELPDVPLLVLNERLGTEGAPDKSVRCYNEVVGAFAATGAVRLVDFNALVCPKTGPCAKTDPRGRELFADGVHFTDAGRTFIAPLLEKSIQKSLSAPAPKPRATGK